MPTKKQPTNSEILQELKILQATVAANDRRIHMLETAKIETDAIAKYLVNHPAQTASESKINKQLIGYIGMAFTIIASLVAAMVAKP